MPIRGPHATGPRGIVRGHDDDHFLVTERAHLVEMFMRVSIFIVIRLVQECSTPRHYQGRITLGVGMIVAVVRPVGPAEGTYFRNLPLLSACQSWPDSTSIAVSQPLP